MNAHSAFASAFPDRVEAVLAAFAKLITARVPGIVWSVEIPASRVYDLVAVLTFMHSDDLETELVAVSVEARDVRGLDD